MRARIPGRATRGWAPVLGCLLSLSAHAPAGFGAEAVLPFTRERLLALGMIESGNNDRARGVAGEVSRFQIHPSVWKAYTRSKAYQDPQVAAQVAERHWHFLARYFYSRTDRVPTDFDMYVLWNTRWGYYRRRGFDPDRVDPRIAARAVRFANLVNLRLAVAKAE